VKKMPVIRYEGPELTPEQRESLIREFTEVAVRYIPRVPKDAYYVFLDEYPDEKVGVGGLVLPKYLEKIQGEMK
jgi:phenylpyruvate tautomerase PptA (4-oxalocrotonate tautomerase family)